MFADFMERVSLLNFNDSLNSACKSFNCLKFLTAKTNIPIFTIIINISFIINNSMGITVSRNILASGKPLFQSV